MTDPAQRAKSVKILVEHAHQKYTVYKKRQLLGKICPGNLTNQLEYKYSYSTEYLNYLQKTNKKEINHCKMYSLPNLHKVKKKNLTVINNQRPPCHKLN